MFPHHENEIAISKALNRTSLAKTWLHSELVFVDGKKMSRSAGNVVTLKDLIKKGYTGRQVRFFLLRSYYKSPIQFSFSYLEEAIRALKRLDNFTGDLISLTMERKLDDNDQIAVSEQENNFIEIIEKYEHTFWEGINDDLNTPKAIGSIFQLARYFNPIILKREISTPCLDRLLSALKEFDSVLSILNLKFPDQDDVIKVRELIQLREQARSKNDWIKADAIRDELAQMGIEILDTPHGVRWRMVTEVSGDF